MWKAVYKGLYILSQHRKVGGILHIKKWIKNFVQEHVGNKWQSQDLNSGHFTSQTIHSHGRWGLENKHGKIKEFLIKCLTFIIRINLFIIKGECEP